MVLKSGSLKLLERSGLVQGCNGIFFTFTLHVMWTVRLFSCILEDGEQNWQRRNWIKPHSCGTKHQINCKCALRPLLNVYTIFSGLQLYFVLDILTSEWRKLHNGELNEQYCSHSIVRVINWRRMRWAGNVARMGDGRGVYRVLMEKPEGKRPLGRQA